MKMEATEAISQRFFKSPSPLLDLFIANTIENKLDTALQTLADVVDPEATPLS